MHWTFSALQQRKPDLLKICEKYQACHLRVFGSVARNEATETSDVDFLVEMPNSQSVLQRVHFKSDLEELLGCRVDLAKAESLPELIQAQVLQEARPL